MEDNSIALLEIEGKGGYPLKIVYPAIGPIESQDLLNKTSHPHFRTNRLDGSILKKMNPPREKYRTSTGRSVYLREATTVESLNLILYDIIHIGFRRSGLRSFSSPFMTEQAYSFRSYPYCLGRYATANEGIYINPPRDQEGKIIDDEETLKSYLSKSKKIGKVWLYGGKDVRHLGFAPYETYKTFQVEPKEFCEGGLAKIIEHLSPGISLFEEIHSKNCEYVFVGPALKKEGRREDDQWFEIRNGIIELDFSGLPYHMDLDGHGDGVQVKGFYFIAPDENITPKED